MKTYKKPVSIVIEVDSEDIMQVMGASGVVGGATQDKEQQSNITLGADAEEGMDAHGKGFSSWE